MQASDFFFSGALLFFFFFLNIEAQIKLNFKSILIYVLVFKVKYRGSISSTLSYSVENRDIFQQFCWQKIKNRGCSRASTHFYWFLYACVYQAFKSYRAERSSKFVVVVWTSLNLSSSCIIVSNNIQELRTFFYLQIYNRIRRDNELTITWKR